MKTLDEFKAADLKAHLGSKFRLNQTPVTLESMDVRSVGDDGATTLASLVFVADEGAVLESGDYLLSHPELGDHLVHVHKISLDADTAPAVELILG
jgi:hypothetical protein